MVHNRAGTESAISDAGPGPIVTMLGMNQPRAILRQVQGIIQASKAKAHGP